MYWTVNELHVAGLCLSVGQVGAVGDLGGDAGAPAHGLFTPVP